MLLDEKMSPALKDLRERYNVQYRVFDRFGEWNFQYELVGRHGAIHLHASACEYNNERNYAAGLEYHYRVPPKYMNKKPASHDHCHLLKVPCWHDGTSSYAVDHYLPLVKKQMHEFIFLSLARDADKAFEEFENNNDN